MERPSLSSFEPMPWLCGMLDNTGGGLPLPGLQEFISRGKLLKSQHFRTKMYVEFFISQNMFANQTSKSEIAGFLIKPRILLILETHYRPKA